MMGRRSWMVAVLFVAAPLVARAQQAKSSAESSDFFEKEVHPVLKANCFKCHGDGKTKGGLSLGSREGVLKGGDIGPVVSLERPDESLLLKAINYKDGLEMPPTGKLAQKEIDILTRWIRAGVPWSGSATPVAAMKPKSKAPRITAQDREHWAYRPVTQPKAPAVKNGGWLRHPIDAFVLAGLEAKNLSPAPPVDSRALGRRVYFDLTGLPPTPEQLDAFVNDPAADAYEQLLDRLLASKHFGEKWARHWLDLVRYAESDGFEFDRAKPFAWRYRDYVIAAFNDDKPYDQFVREQLAGDVLDKVTADSLIATGYYRLGQYDSGAGDRLQQTYDVLDGIVSTTSQVFLGMSMGCARCHDHKKDPIPQRDYYRLLAFFHNLTDLGGRKPMMAPKVEGSTEPRHMEVPALFGPGGAGQAFGSKSGKTGMFVMAVSEQQTASPTHIMYRGNPRVPGEKVEPGFPEVLVDPTTFKSEPPTITGGRKALAEWITDPKNPATARVMVNRLWQHLFGRGIAPSPNEFGLQGEVPTHPELLDWLAHDFTANGWKMKRLIRLMMTSSTYRMSATANEKALKEDPSNVLFWRYNLRRLTAEEVRDSMLTVSGKLNLKMGGPSVLPVMPREVLAGQARPGEGWRPSSSEEAVRRSVYVFVKRSLLVPILAQFDLADTDASCPVRFTTTVATQALGMLNGSFSNEQATALAERLRKETPANLRDQVQRAIRLTTGRIPQAEETDRDAAFIQNLMMQYRLNEQDALRCYCLVLLNANEFVYLD